MTTEDSVFERETPSTDGARESHSPAGAKPLLHYLIELVELEVQLVALRCAKVARDAIVRVCVFGVALLALLVGIVFLYVGVFRVLEKFLLVWQICIIYAVVHFLLGAGILLAVGAAKKSAQPPAPGDSHVN